MEIRVSARSRPGAVAGAIAHALREHQCAEVQAIGAGAVYQAVKALAIARGFLQEEGLDLVCVPMLVEVDINGWEHMAVKVTVEIRGGVAETGN